MSARGQTTYMQRLYDGLAGWYEPLVDAVYRGRDDAWREACLCELSEGDWVLEVGAGTGRTEALCDCAVDRYVSVDVSRGMLSAGEHSRPLQGDAHALPFPSESFDTVLGTLLMSTRINQTDALAEMQRVTTESGRIVLVDKFSQTAAHKRALDRVKNVVTRPLAFDFDVPIESLACDCGLDVVHRTDVPRNLGMIELVILE